MNECKRTHLTKTIFPMANSQIGRYWGTTGYDLYKILFNSEICTRKREAKCYTIYFTIPKARRLLVIWNLNDNLIKTQTGRKLLCMGTRWNYKRAGKFPKIKNRNRSEVFRNEIFARKCALYWSRCCGRIFFSDGKRIIKKKIGLLFRRTVIFGIKYVQSTFFFFLFTFILMVQTRKAFLGKGFMRKSLK